MSERDFDGAAALFKRTLEMDPAFAYSHLGLAEMYTLQNRYDEALAEVDRLPGGPCMRKLFRASILKREGKAAEARSLAEETVRRGCEGERISPAHLGGLWMQLGEKERAFGLLQQACAAKDPGLLMIRFESSFDEVKPDPRYKDLLRCAGLE